jgi:hypothetical protein
VANLVRSQRWALGPAVVALLAVPALSAVPAHAGTRALKPIADTQVGGGHKRGHAKTLHVGTHPRRRVLIRFNAKGVKRTIRSAKLRIRVRSRRSARLRVFARSARGKWSERSARKRSTRVRGRVVARMRLKHRRHRHWVVLNVTRAVKHRVIDFVITSPSRRGIAIGSRESRRSRPRLVVRTGGAPESPPGGGPVTPPVTTRPRRVLPPPSFFLAPNGSDANPCTRVAPCLTVERGYRIASPGQVVEMAGGDYPEQTVGEDPSKTSPDAVWLRSAPGATVTLKDLALEGASNIGFLEISVSDQIKVINFDPDVLGSHDVTFDTMTAQTMAMVGRVARVSVYGGSYGNTVDWQPQIGKANLGDSDASRPQDILIEGASFHDYVRSGSSVHTECLQVLAVDRLTIRHSRFNNCDGTGDIGITDGPSDNITIENSFLGKAGDAFYSMQITKNVRNLVLRNNSASKAAIFSDNENGGPYTITGNYMPFSGALCASEGTYSHNVFDGGTCGPTDMNVPAMRFVNEDGFDLHLAPNSEAIDHGDGGSYPADDIDGQGRPAGGGPDAGADER